MKLKKILPLAILLILLSCCCISAHAEIYSGECGIEGDNVTYTLNTDTGVLEISGTEDMCDYYDLDEIPWYPYADSIQTVSISDGVTSIGVYAFSECHYLTSVDIPETVMYIGDYAFMDCYSLVEINLPDNITSFGFDPFLGTGYSSDDSNWEDGVLYIGKYLIDADSSLSGTYSVKPGTSVIASRAFDSCAQLNTIIIPNSVIIIGSRAFEDCSSLTYISLPDSLTDIGYDALVGTAYYDNEENWHHGVLYIGKYLFRANDTLNGAYTVHFGTKIIAEYAFEDCAGLTSIIIPESVTNVGAYAFDYCSGLTSATVPECMVNGSRRFATYFYGCYNLTDVTILDGVTGIGYGAFYNCETLESIRIPDSVVSIDELAFSRCSNLKSIVIPRSVTKISYNAFFGSDNIQEVYYGGSAQEWETLIVDIWFFDELWDVPIFFNGASLTLYGGEVIDDNEAYTYSFKMKSE